MNPPNDRRKEIEIERNQRVEVLAQELRGFLGEEKRSVGLEIGCGHGHWLTSFAESQPDTLWVGADIITRRIDKARRKAEKRNLSNVLFLKAEAMELLEAWPCTVPFESLFLLYPDPWPKKRHAKNRLTRSQMLDALAKKAKEDAILYFRTDDPDFFAWTRESIEEHPHWQLGNSPWPHEHGSYFQDLLGIHASLTAGKIFLVTNKSCE